MQSGTARSVSDRDSPESVVLPPIRTATSSPRVNYSDTKRRQREDDEFDGISTSEDMPSPPRVLLLSTDSSKMSSTVRAEDLSAKYKLVNPSSDSFSNVGGDSMSSLVVGNQSERESWARL